MLFEGGPHGGDRRRSAVQYAAHFAADRQRRNSRDPECCSASGHSRLVSPLSTTTCPSTWTADVFRYFDEIERALLRCASRCLFYLGLRDLLAGVGAIPRSATWRPPEREPRGQPRRCRPVAQSLRPWMLLRDGVCRRFGVEGAPLQSRLRPRGSLHIASGSAPVPRRVRRGRLARWSLPAECGRQPAMFDHWRPRRV
ncbi:hypothetical protein R1CP_38845 (plasmid) [Rhodococcus opacus]|uniref:Uncharacterized protein n=1 Tax=Rhodococcus opacus TaxID=37919 RepID=A0A1B1KI43_RHOOP|nr:hypothetical protein R1CP_38340 [Rhodococcus opacus]ANS32357.1 hypothetical protein R1CP_38845 [Rhodococcus opacus]